MDLKKLLKTGLFEHLAKSDLDVLSGKFVEVNLSPDTTLFEEGDSGDNFYIIESGNIDVIKAAGTPSERLISVRGPGEFVGELSLINPNSLRMASVRTNVGAMLWKLSQKDFHNVLRDNPAFSYQMVIELSKRLTIAHELTITDLQEKNRLLSKAYDELKASQEQLIEKERIEKELEVAKSIQKSILPDQLPTIKNYSFGAIMHPARAVGGDFFDIFPLDKNRIGIMIGDVADKGVPSALVMAQTHALIYAESFREPIPTKVLEKVNKHILKINRSGLFVTVIYGVLNISNHTFNYARAGHEIPIYKLAGNTAQLLNYDTGQPLGLFEKPKLDEKNIQLDHNSRLLLYTDGLSDIREKGGEQFGLDRLIKLYNGIKEKSPAIICNKIMESLVTFQGEEEQYDDITMIVISNESKQ
jgi:serine phosphatase RsbU (regulator of sigma subunit)